MFAVGVAATNASTRVVFAGRARDPASILGHINAGTRTPDASTPRLAGRAADCAVFGLAAADDHRHGLMGCSYHRAIVLYLMTNASTFLLSTEVPTGVQVPDHASGRCSRRYSLPSAAVVALWLRSLDVIGMGFDNTYPVNWRCRSRSPGRCRHRVHIYLHRSSAACTESIATGCSASSSSARKMGPVRRVGVQ